MQGIEGALTAGEDRPPTFALTKQAMTARALCLIRPSPSATALTIGQAHTVWANINIPPGDHLGRGRGTNPQRTHPRRSRRKPLSEEAGLARDLNIEHVSVFHHVPYVLSSCGISTNHHAHHATVSMLAARNLSHQSRETEVAMAGRSKWSYN